MAQRKTLTERQVFILRWIAEGSPEGVVDGDHRRISAAAVRARGLATASGRGTTWVARVTADGRRYLAQVDGDAARGPNRAELAMARRPLASVSP